MTGPEPAARVADFRLALPLAWVELDLNPATRAQSIAKTLEERGDAGQALGLARDQLADMLEGIAAQAEAKNGAYAAFSSDILEDKPVSAALIVSDGPRRRRAASPGKRRHERRPYSTATVPPTDTELRQRSPAAKPTRPSGSGSATPPRDRWPWWSAATSRTSAARCGAWWPKPRSPRRPSCSPPVRPWTVTSWGSACPRISQDGCRRAGVFWRCTVRPPWCRSRWQERAAKKRVAGMADIKVDPDTLDALAGMATQAAQHYRGLDATMATQIRAASGPPAP